jgi:hypothetical protein
MQYIVAFLSAILFLTPCQISAEKLTKTIYEYGAKADGVTDDTLAFNQAISASGSVGNLLLSKGTYRIGNNLTIPSGMTLVFQAGAKIKVDANLTMNGLIISQGQGPHFDVSSRIILTIANHLEAGEYQIFSGSGNVNFSGGVNQKIYVAWWKTGTDHTSAVRAAIRAASQNGTNHVILPHVCTITDTISVPSGFTIAGAGLGTIVTFNPGSPAGKPAFQTKALSAPYGSSFVVFRDFQLNCNAVGQYGFKIGEDDSEGNVWYGEQAQIINVTIQNFTVAGIWLRRTIRFYGRNIKLYCSNGSYGDAIDGLLVDQATNNIDGNNLATFVNCSFGHVRRYAVYLHNSGRNFTFIGCDFESTGYEGLYIYKENSLSYTYLGNIKLIGCWFEAQNQAPGRTKGEYFSAKISYDSGGGTQEPVQFIGCTLSGGGSGNREVYANNAIIYLDGCYIAAGGIEGVGTSQIRTNNLYGRLTASLSGGAAVYDQPFVGLRSTLQDYTLPADVSEHDLANFDVPIRSLGTRGGFKMSINIYSSATFTLNFKETSTSSTIFSKTVNAGTHEVVIIYLLSDEVHQDIQWKQTGPQTVVYYNTINWYNHLSSSYNYKFTAQKRNSADTVTMQMAWIEPIQVAY